jgi:filamentous hemagglutinin family protein
MKRKKSKRKIIQIALKLVLICSAAKSFANPSGMTVSLGSATAQQLGSQLNVTVGQLTVLNWSSFNIAAGETTTFLQPSSGSVVFNIINSGNPSQIFGNLNANGTVILANANGLYFGPNSMIKVGGSFIGTTAPLSPDVGSGSSWQFTGMPPLASIVNYGQIQVGQGQSLFLIAEDIQNYGGLSAPAGNVTLAAGQSVLVSESPDGRGLSAQVQLPQGSVDNFGNITADAGTIALQAQVVNQDGMIQANSVQDVNGTVELVAGSTLNLGAGSTTSAEGNNVATGSGGVTLQAGSTINNGGSVVADGSSILIEAPTVNQNGTLQANSLGSINGAIAIDAAAGLNLGAGSSILANGDSTDSGASPGGFVVLHSPGSYSDSSASTIFVSGNSLGQGGVVEILNNNKPILAAINGSYATFKNPNALKLSTAATSTSSSSPNLNVNALPAYTDIYLYNLELSSQWSLGTAGTAATLNLNAMNDITFDNGSGIKAGQNWSLNLNAGQFFSGTAPLTGNDDITLNGTASLQAQNGNINLWAAENILVGSGSIFTTAGGSIFADALDGDINAGTSNGSGSNGKQTEDYLFSSLGATPNAILGGMSTKAGGNVTLIAGDDIISVPTVPAKTDWPGASGTYGAGNVTLVAGSQITGNFNLANGTGNILAGVQVTGTEAAALQNQGADPAGYQYALGNLESAVMQNTGGGGNIGASSAPAGENDGVTLSLIQGTWNAWAANDIYINEVNNPDGTFNPNSSLSTPAFLFNYAANATVNFWAGNAINLLGDVGDTLARVSQGNATMQPIYAPILTLNAGAGGITVDDSIVLYPSSEGELQIITRDGGDLTGAVLPGSTSLTGITMSDSDSTSWTGTGTFQDHAATPLYVGNDTPVTLDISGSIESFSLTVPTFADINVLDNTYNFGFLGQNLSADQTTCINVGQTAKANLEKAGILNPTTDGGLPVGGNITYRGDVTSQTLTSAVTLDQFKDIIAGNSSLAGAFSYDPTTGTISYIGVMSATTEGSTTIPGTLLDPTDANGNLIFTGTQLTAWQSDITQLYTASQTASLGNNGLALAGPGKFNIVANTIDLGISGGISVLAPDSALETISPYGANIKIKTTGDLDMTTSVIANESLLGGIKLDVGGTLDVGGELTPFGSANSLEGIFTTSGGNLSVTAYDDVNVDGSRIAAYNGGNINVTSTTGDINAGLGGAGFVALTALELDPKTGALTQIPATIPGSGILATTIFGSDAALGNITLDAPNGSVNAQQGGVIQIAFNGANAKDNFIQITAGDDINAQGSGIIGSNIKLSAGGNINGVVIGSQSINIDSAQNVNVTAVSSGNVDINASGDVSGTIVSGGNLDVSGSSIDASLVAENVSASGDTAGASMGIPQSNVATVNTPVADNATTASAKADTDAGDDEKKKRKPVALTQKVSRVTVTLPPKNNSRTQNQNSSPAS